MARQRVVEASSKETSPRLQVVPQVRRRVHDRGHRWYRGDRRLVALALTIAVFIFTLLLRHDAGVACLVALLVGTITGLVAVRVSVGAGLICLALCPLL